MLLKVLLKVITEKQMNKIQSIRKDWDLIESLIRDKSDLFEQVEHSAY